MPSAPAIRCVAGADVDHCFGIERASQRRLTVVYCRVSRHGQPTDLESQRRAMERIARDEIGMLSVAHRECRCRFGFDWVRALDGHCAHILLPLYGLHRHRKQIREAAEDDQGSQGHVHPVRSDGQYQLAAARDRHAAIGNHGKARTRNLLCQAAHTVVNKADTIACKDWTARMKSARYRHKDTTPPFALLGQGRHGRNSHLRYLGRRGSALALVNPACTSQIDSRTGLLQGHRQGDWFYCLDRVVLDVDTHAVCNIRACLHDDESTLWRPYREVKALLAKRTRTAEGSAPPGLELQGHANVPPSTEGEAPSPVKNRAN